MSNRGRPRGFKESEETRAKKRAAMLDRRAQRQPPLTWSREWEGEGFRPFGDRLDFMTPEAQHATTGRLSILSPHAQEEA